ncbi:MAG: homoserine kinase [Erythrobacter sp.]|nr:MAG: homoserine kinase [Erythrobacter sp.]
MAVYTHLTAEVLASLIAHYDVGELVSAKGIAEGVSNSNWLIETTGADGKGARFILTMYERRIDLADLPFFLDLLDHLAARDCPVPGTVHDREGNSHRWLGDPGSGAGAGKAVALIEFIPGVSVGEPTPAQARNVGMVLAQMHAAAESFPVQRRNELGPETSARVLADCGTEALAAIDPALPAAIAEAQRVARDWPQDLPRSIIHSDLFPDNVLMLGERVSGLIDFYFACHDMMAYDLAVTHAAWSFADGGRTYRAEVGRALIAGYQSVRELLDIERRAMPLLAQGAALRFISSRAQDWIDTPADAMVTRKDPMDFHRRLHFYLREGDKVFA